MTENKLRAMMNTADRRISAKVQQAVIDVMIRKHTWRTAAIRNDCTESGICRCMQRLGFKSTVVDNG